MFHSIGMMSKCHIPVVTKSKLKQIFLLLVIVVFLEIFWTRSCRPYYPVVPGDIRTPPKSLYLTDFGVSHWRPEKVKKILMWTPYFDLDGWTKYINDTLQSCPNLLGKCAMTDNKSEILSSSAVVFHMDDLWKIWFLSLDSKSWKPQYRDPSQVWVMLSQEAPPHLWGWFPPNFFNWTMSYRRDSTIFHTYGHHVKKSHEELQNETRHFQNEAKINYFKYNSKMAVVHVSNCMDQLRRYKIVRELSKYVEVDEFGHCSGKIVCNASVPFEKCMDIFRPYKFYLAFENTVCRDYITEKFWLALNVKQQIPVVAVSKHTSEILPPKSYLNVFDFPSIKALADEMIRIGNNETLFNSFFEWKRYYKPAPSGFCSLCNALHENRTAQVYHDLEAWIQHDDCPRFSVRNFMLCCNQCSFSVFFFKTSFCNLHCSH